MAAKIERSVSLYSYQQEYYEGRMNLEDCIRAGFDAYGVGAVLPDTEHYRARRAHEAEVAARLNAERESGLSDEDIARKSVEKMKKLGAVTIEEVEAAKAEA